MKTTDKQRIWTIIRFMENTHRLLTAKAHSMEELSRWGEKWHYYKSELERLDVSNDEMQLALRLYSRYLKKYYDNYQLQEKDKDLLLHWRSIDLQFDVKVEAAPSDDTMP